MTNFTAADNIFEVYEAINISSGNLLVYMSLISIFVILLMSLLRKNPPPESFVASSAATTMVSLIFLGMGLLDIVWVIGFGSIFATSAVFLYIKT